MNTTEGWHPTPAHARAVLGALVLTLMAVLARRPDLLVLATPLFVVAIWAVLLRPSGLPDVRQFVGHAVVGEGEGTTWHVGITDPFGRVDDVAAVFDGPARVDQRPFDGQAVVSLRDDGDEQLAVVIRPTRWGRHRLSPPQVVSASGWNGYRYVWRNWADGLDLLTVPRPATFDAVAPGVHARGLVGVNRSPRYGSGTEFASVRLFQPGDKLRRIHWPESLRARSLHVTSTWADQDRQVVLLVDAFEDVGESAGIDGRASSLDISLRAAAAIAEHYTRTGDRVALVTMGARGVQRLPPAVGYRHLRRLLEVLARVEPADALIDTGRLPRGMSRGALVVMLSPLLSTGALQRLAAIADHGLNVVTIDCLPTDIADEDPGDPYAGIAWRIELMKRERRLRQVREAGIAVVPWHGPGSLDLVLRGLHRRASLRPGRS